MKILICIVSSMACIVDLKNIIGKAHCYSLGMVKIEAFDDRRFMHQTIRVCMREGREERKGGRIGEGITHL